MTVQQNDSRLVSPNSLPDFPRNLSQNSFLAQNGSSPDTIRAILVDDDDFYREAIATELGYLGFSVTSFSSGEPMLAHFAQNADAEVIVLDWRLQNGLGIDLLPLLHERGIHMPVVFLTGMPAVAAEYTALDLGAVDFVDKARGTAILAKRLRLIVQSSRGQPQNDAASSTSTEPAQCGKLKLHPDIARAYWNGIDVELTLTEFKIVYLLVSRAGEYVTYRSVYDCVRYTGFVAGNGEDGFRTNVRSSIKRIRNKFRQLDDGFSDIENYPAFGYRWRGAPSGAA
ncbi:MAG: response regulator transcription factor [Rhodospirillales bacterium]|nr:response regulator transcription factor [Rhodospirillales bacterium]